ncbi:hypothetical protein JQS43_21315 [Natronosporangium hydrolyticum]|uniref:Uncharacterized protein n=1 Tax=Natronosporangium hydrolyticum TaxID=2811111 RepID=A0A895YIU6_9ACTN|nr:hypothetical protein JQS43_21315 [Natronosporangium hydrolyticum]
MPTSVLLAVLAAAGLLALAPALVRRYDATERLEAARAQSTARVLSRTRRRRTVPGRRPINPPLSVDHGPKDMEGAKSRPEPHDQQPQSPVRRRAREGPRRGKPRTTRRDRTAIGRPRRRPRQSPAIYRRRRALAALVLLNVVKLVGVATVGPGFWIGFAVTGTLLLAYLGYLRQLAVADRRRRRAEARHRAWVAARQAQVRQEQERRLAERRAAARRLAEQREQLRRAGDGWSADPTVSYRRAGRIEQPGGPREAASG